MTASVGGDWEYEGPRRSFSELGAAAWAQMDSEMATAVDLMSPRMAGLSLMAPMDVDMDMDIGKACAGQAPGGAAADDSSLAAPGQPATSQHSHCSSLSGGKVLGQGWADAPIHWG
jgi:hypothetical protein